MGAVLKQAGTTFPDEARLDLENPHNVLLVLDRSGEEAAPFLIDVRRADSRVVMRPRFPRESLDRLERLTPFEGRRQAIRENLIPILYDIPNWLEVVKTLARYSLERDDAAMGEDRSRVMEIVLGFLFAAARQPFDGEARSESEYAVARLVESIVKSADDESIEDYLPFLEQCLDFLADDLFRKPLNSMDRRIISVRSIQSALKKRRTEIAERLGARLDRMAAQALLTALDQIEPCPDTLVFNLEHQLEEADFLEKERFRTEILAEICRYSGEETHRRRVALEERLDANEPVGEKNLRATIDFIKGAGSAWRLIMNSFLEMVEHVPAPIQSAFAEILVDRIPAVREKEIKQVLVDGLCRIVVRLEKRRKQASAFLVNSFAERFLDRAIASTNTDETIACFKAIESLGVTLGRNNYFLIAQELINHVVTRPLIRPQEKRFTIEDDDTGEPLVLAEETAGNAAHVEQIKALLAIIASNPRIMHRLMPYLTVQLEIGGTRIADEDLIQYWISCLLRANSSVSHFLARTLVKAIPCSFKDIGPLDNLRLTAAGLAKDLANRGVKPIGNFLGKLRGDIHWRGSIENFYFCQAILKYFFTGHPEALAEWMPRDSMPHLTMDQWLSETEAEGIVNLTRTIFRDYGVELNEKENVDPLNSVDTSAYRDNPKWPEFSRKTVVDVIDLLRGLHTKYFVTIAAGPGDSVSEGLARFGDIIQRRQNYKENVLTPDIREPMPAPATLTEGAEGYAAEMERIKKDQPGAPIILRAKKAGHAYAQKAVYIEERFEVFSNDLGLEAEQETLATSINNTHFDTLTMENLPDALTFLDDLIRGVAVNGHSSYYLLEAGKDLRRAGALGLTLDKVRDLIKIVKKELDDISDSYRYWFDAHVDGALNARPLEKLPRKLKNLTTLKEIPDSEFFKNYLKTLYISDLQARDGNLRVLETFTDKLELFLNQRLAESGRAVETGKADGESVPFYFPDQGELSACKIGLKASLLRFAENTPPYFVITTDQKLQDSPAMFGNEEFRRRLEESVQKLERRCGRTFGDPANPALFSVRSGARLSMPGMMITITNVGISDDIADALARTVGGWFAYDCYRRFLQEFGQSAFGVQREEFQEIIDKRKANWKVKFKADMTGDQMKDLAFAYKERLGRLAPDAVRMLDDKAFYDILMQCALVVLHSYDGPAARKYRQAAGIDGNWRTAAIVQSMVYGNMELEFSGTGVVSYNPFTLDLRGDFASANQGTDVVDGKVSTIPVYDLWKQRECLAARMPDSWKQLSSTLFPVAEKLHFNVNAEYTIEKGRVFILQFRKNRERKERVPPLEAFGYTIAARGTGVSGKIFRGILVTDRNQIAPYRHINKAKSIIDAMNQSLPEGEKLDGFIFVVNDPIPEEIMDEVFSLPVNTALVSRLGGRGAHAADIARSLGRVYVGQVRGIAKFSGKPESVKFGDMVTPVGSKMIIHGQTGEIAFYPPNRETSQ